MKPIPLPKAAHVPPAGYQTLAVPGGFLHYSVALGKLNAHCSCTDHVSKSKCKMDRTLNPASDRLGFGRPLGALLAWLSFECGTQPLHSAAKSVVLGLGFHAKRLELRKWFRTLASPLAVAILAADGDNGGDDAEPLVCK
jgi:hypothetical protein